MNEVLFHVSWVLQGTQHRHKANLYEWKDGFGSSNLMEAKCGSGSNQVKTGIKTAEVTFYARVQIIVTAP